MKFVLILVLVFVAVFHDSVAQSKQPIPRLALHSLNLERQHDDRIVPADKNLRSKVDQKGK